MARIARLHESTSVVLCMVEPERAFKAANSAVSSANVRPSSEERSAGFCGT